MVEKETILGYRKTLIGHIILDILGFLPMVGVVPDLANAVWYSIDWWITGCCKWDVALSLVSAIPIPGVFDTGAKGFKYGRKIWKGSTELLEIFMKFSQKIMKAIKTLIAQILKVLWNEDDALWLRVLKLSIILSSFFGTIYMIYKWYTGKLFGVIDSKLIKVPILGDKLKASKELIEKATDLELAPELLKLSIDNLTESAADLADKVTEQAKEKFLKMTKGPNLNKNTSVSTNIKNSAKVTEAKERFFKMTKGPNLNKNTSVAKNIKNTAKVSKKRNK